MEEAIQNVSRTVQQWRWWLGWFDTWRIIASMGRAAKLVGALVQRTAVGWQATMQVPFVHQEEPNSLSNLGRVSASMFINLRYCREARGLGWDCKLNDLVLFCCQNSRAWELLSGTPEIVGAHWIKGRNCRVAREPSNIGSWVRLSKDFGVVGSPFQSSGCTGTSYTIIHYIVMIKHAGPEILVTAMTPRCKPSST